jgi:alpha-ketoglutarate-dependent taurine dioxygenase
MKKALSDHGWVKTHIDVDDGFDACVLELAESLGNPVRHRRSQGLVHELTPTTASEGHPNSLTARYSTGAFPLHVDTAHWLVPCRYVILACRAVRDGSRGTNLLNIRDVPFSDSENHAFKTAPFLVRNGRNSFYGTILSNDREFIRYDPGCMSEVGEGNSLLKGALSEQRLKDYVTCITWSPGTVLILDNWKVLHGRGEGPRVEKDRTLGRVLIA